MEKLVILAFAIAGVQMTIPQEAHAAIRPDGRCLVECIKSEGGTVVLAKSRRKRTYYQGRQRTYYRGSTARPFYQGSARRPSRVRPFIGEPSVSRY